MIPIRSVASSAKLVILLMAIWGSTWQTVAVEETKEGKLIAMIEDYDDFMVYTGPEHFCLAFSNPTSAEYKMITVNGDSIFAVQQDGTYREISPKEFGKENELSVENLKSSLLRKLDTLPIDYNPLESHPAPEVTTNSSSAPTKSSNSTSQPLVSGPKHNDGSIVVYHHLDEPTRADVYLVDYLGNLNDIFSGSVGIFQRDGFSIFYRNERFFSYHHPNLPFKINRMTVIGDMVIFVYNDTSVLGKSMKILDPVEMGLVARARAEVETLIEDNLSHLEASNEVQSSSSFSSKLSAATGRGLNRLDGYSFSLEQPTQAPSQS